MPQRSRVDARQSSARVCSRTPTGQVTMSALQPAPKAERRVSRRPGTTPSNWCCGRRRWLADRRHRCGRADRAAGNQAVEASRDGARAASLTYTMAQATAAATTAVHDRWACRHHLHLASREDHRRGGTGRAGDGQGLVHRRPERHCHPGHPGLEDAIWTVERPDRNNALGAGQRTARPMSPRSDPAGRLAWPTSQADEGSITSYIVFLACHWSSCAGLVFDAGGALTDRQRAADIAEQAARSAADQLAAPPAARR